MSKIIVRLLLVLFLLSPVSVFAGQQLSGNTAQVIIDNVRTYLDAVGSSTTGPWTDTQLLQHINNGIIDITYRTKCLETIETEAVQAGVSVYHIDTSYINIRGVVYTSGDTDYSKSLEHYDMLDGTSEGHGIGQNVQQVDEPVYWCESGNSLYVWPQANTTTGTLLIFLYERPSLLTSVTDAIPIPSIYEPALTYYVVAQAFPKVSKHTIAEYYMRLYLGMLGQKVIKETE